MKITDSIINDSKAIRLVLTERLRQIQKWGPQTHDINKWYTILSEEMGEVAKALNENKMYEAKLELEQVAAVALAILGGMLDEDI